MGKGSVPGAPMDALLTGFLSVLPKIDGEKLSLDLSRNRTFGRSCSVPV
jgi:hypothetical protein